MKILKFNSMCKQIYIYIYNELSTAINNYTEL